MIIDYGLIVFFGFVFLAIKLPRRQLLRLLGHSLALDLGVSAVAYILHWGTFSGIMVAAVAGMMTSIATSLGRRLYGYIEDEKYYPGIIKYKLEDLK